MIAVLTVLHVIVCAVLIAVVLLQRGKGAEMGAVFGGGASATVFGSRGAGTFLGKLTTGCAVIFMLTSLSLAYLVSQSTGERLFEGAIEDLMQEDTPLEQFGTIPPEESSEADSVPATQPDTPASGSDTAGGEGGEAATDTPDDS
jgi:preprotein translocase subunit SecG